MHGQQYIYIYIFVCLCVCVRERERLCRNYVCSFYEAIFPYFLIVNLSFHYVLLTI